MKSALSLVFPLIIISTLSGLFSCSEDVASTGPVYTSQDVIGTWRISLLAPMPKMDITVIFMEQASTGSLAATVDTTIGGVNTTLTLYRMDGTWAIAQDTLTLTGTQCQKPDSLGSLTDFNCGSPVVFPIDISISGTDTLWSVTVGSLKDAAADQGVDIPEAYHAVLVDLQKIPYSYTEDVASTGPVYTSQDVIGTWRISLLAPMPKMDITVIFMEQASTGSLAATVDTTIGGVNTTLTLYRMDGTWAIAQDTLTLTGTQCQKPDSLGSLTDFNCGSPVVFPIDISISGTDTLWSVTVGSLKDAVAAQGVDIPEAFHALLVDLQKIP